MAACRGMRMGYAPLLALLEPARARGYKRLAVVGIPCQVYALRALEAELGFERLYVIGTPCSDNTTTERFHQFLALLSEDPDSITYLEFRADFHVELRFTDGRTRTIPFLQLPISKLPPDFFPLTCRTCVDYTNVLADITVGYMAGRGEQWLLVRNERGEEMLSLLGDEIRTSAPTSAGKRAGAVKGFMANVERAAGGLPLRRMPDWVRPIVGFLMPRIGPRGLEFRPNAGGDEGDRDDPASTPRGATPDAHDGALARMGAGGTLRADAGRGRASTGRAETIGRGPIRPDAVEGEQASSDPKGDQRCLQTSQSVARRLPSRSCAVRARARIEEDCTKSRSP